MYKGKVEITLASTKELADLCEMRNLTKEPGEYLYLISRYGVTYRKVQ